MSFSELLKYPFTNEKWGTNLLLASVCMLIPLVGPMVLMGWILESAHARIVNPMMTGYPDFDFNRFSQYLKRGLMPFLGMMVQSTIVSILYVPFSMLILVPMFVGGNNPELFVLLMVLYVVVVMSVSIIGSALWMGLCGPLWLRSGLSGSFGDAFHLPTVKAMIKLNGGMLFKLMLYVFGLMCLGMVVGTVLYCTMIGIILLYPMGVYVSMVWYHGMELVYKDYLDKGGEPFPINPEFTIEINDNTVGGFPGRPPMSPSS